MAGMVFSVDAVCAKTPRLSQFLCQCHAALTPMVAQQHRHRLPGGALGQ